MNGTKTSEWVTGKVKLNIGGEPLEMEMTVPAQPVKPHRMLPVFQQMSNAFVDMSIKAVEATGEKISCKKGCGACCSQPVPISEVEVYQIAELVESMPEPRRSEIKARFARGVEHFKKINWFDRMQSLATLPAPKDPNYQRKEVIDLAMEYFYENIPCPFLEEGSCSIHPDRPLACREYLVTTPAENCSKPTAQTVSVMNLLVKPSVSVRALGRTQNSAELAMLPLIRALEFASTYPERFAEKTGERWAAEFFSRLAHQEIPKKGIKPKKAKPAAKRPKRRKHR